MRGLFTLLLVLSSGCLNSTYLVSNRALVGSLEKAELSDQLQAARREVVKAALALEKANGLVDARTQAAADPGLDTKAKDKANAALEKAKEAQVLAAARAASSQRALETLVKLASNPLLLPPRSYPDSADDVHSTLTVPATEQDSFAVMIARCQAAARDKRKSLASYIPWRWMVLVTGSALATTSTILAGVNDGNNSAIGPIQHQHLRVGTIVTGAVGLLLTTIYASVGFENRIDVARRELLKIRQAMDRARNGWPAGDSATRAKLLEDMAVHCNAFDLVETKQTTPTESPTEVAEAFREAVGRLVSTLQGKNGDPLTDQRLKIVDELNAVKDLSLRAFGRGVSTEKALLAGSCPA